MKILQVSDRYRYLGGVEQYIRALSCALEDRGHSIGVVYGIRENGAPAGRGRAEYFVPELSSGTVLPAPARAQLGEIVRREAPGVIYVHNVSNPAVIECLASMRPTVRFIHDVATFCPNWRKTLSSRDTLCPYPMGWRCLANAYLNRCLPRHPWRLLSAWRYGAKVLKVSRRLPKVVVASGYMKRCLIQNRFAPGQIEVLPYFTHPERGVQVGFDDFILFLGRLHETKGIDYLILAMEKLPRPLKLLIIGGGPLKERLLGMVDRLNLGGRIEFLGPLAYNALNAYLARCLALAVPSVWPEPFGIVGIEAMSYGKPVVAFDVGGISEWLEDGVNGFLVKRGDVDGLAGKIRFLFDHKEKARQMGGEGEKIFRARFTEDTHVERLMEIFSGVMR